MQQEKVRVRIAPSPTGSCHLGLARNALYNLIYARQHKGAFILRIEDTDLKRSTKESEEGVYEALRWLGLEWDEGPDKDARYGPYRQSERLGLYREQAERLLAEGKAYHCYCTPQELAAERRAAQKEGRTSKYSGRCRTLTQKEQQVLLDQGHKPAIRFQVEPQMVSFRDLVRGEIAEDAGLYGDFIILKSDGFPVYNYAVVVDDHFMRISHVFRSAEHIPNTFRQILIYQALKLQLPYFAHFPLLLNPDRSKISKRYGAVHIGEFRDQGYLKEALLNFIALLGWNPGTEQEIFSLEDLVEAFSLDGISPSDAIFDRQKLDWMNGYYIRSFTVPELTERVLPFLVKARLIDAKPRPGEREHLEEAIVLGQERMKLLSEAPYLLEFFLVEEVEHDPALFLSKRHSPKEIREVLRVVRERLEALPAWDEERLEATLRGLAKELAWRTGELFMPVRIAVTGRRAAPPLFATMRVIGRAWCLRRLEAAQGTLGEAVTSTSSEEE